MSPYDRARAENLDEVRRAGNGSRNDTLNRAAFATAQLSKAGRFDAASCMRELLEAAKEAGLTEREARATIRSAWRAGLAEPRTIGNDNEPDDIPRFLYRDATGRVLYAKARVDLPDAKYKYQYFDGQRWRWGKNGASPVPYRLPDLAKAPADAVLYMAEGEKHADKLASWGLLATSLKDWSASFSSYVAGRTVIILPDNDEDGQRQAAKAASLVKDAGGSPHLVELPGLPIAGDIMDWIGTAEDLATLVSEAVAETADNARKPLSATPYKWKAPGTLPRRPWQYGRQLLRGSVFVIIAPGATGKTALKIGTALALCTGRPLLGQTVWDGPKRVWIWNLEDSLADLTYSIQAAALHWGISEDDIGGRLFVDSGLDGATLKLARMTRDGPQIDAEVSRQIADEIRRREIDVLMIDPFISSHGLNDENDNAAVDMVAKEWSRIATATSCSVVLAHHSKKLNGGEVTAEASRGASALVDAARGGLALNTMTKAEAEGFGIALDQRRRFFRADDAKPNRAPPGAGHWFEMVSTHLGNADDGGDSVGVATSWSPPDPFEDVSTHHLRLAQGRIADGEWRESSQAKDWAGRAIADVLDLDLQLKADRRRAAAILKTWIANGALRIEERPDRNGDRRKFVVVGAVA